MQSVQPGKEDPLAGIQAGSAWLGSSSAGKALGGPDGLRAEHEPAVALTAVRAHSTLGCVGRNTGLGRDHSPLLSPYYSAPRLLLPFLGLHEKGVDKLKCVQQGPPRWLG